MILGKLKLWGAFGVVGLLLLAVAYGVGHHDATRDAQVTIQRLEATVAAYQSALKRLQDEYRQNELLLEHYRDSIDRLTVQIADQVERIQDLEENDPSVADYLRTPIPPALACVLNHEPPTSPRCRGDGGVAPGGAGSPLPGAQE